MKLADQDPQCFSSTQTVNIVNEIDHWKSEIHFQLNFLNLKCKGLGVLFRIISSLNYKEVDIIQLLTIEALIMMWYRPESTNIDRGGGKVNIGILMSISHHDQSFIVCVSDSVIYLGHRNGNVMKWQNIEDGVNCD